MYVEIQALLIDLQKLLWNSPTYHTKWVAGPTTAKRRLGIMEPHSRRNIVEIAKCTTSLIYTNQLPTWTNSLQVPRTGAAVEAAARLRTSNWPFEQSLVIGEFIYPDRRNSAALEFHSFAGEKT